MSRTATTLPAQQTVTITYHDGSSEQVTISRHVIADEALHLFRQGSRYVDEVHVGSWPLASIKKWRREPS